MSQSDNSDVEVIEIKYYLETNLNHFFACMNDCTLNLVWLYVYDHNYNLTLNSYKYE